MFLAIFCVYCECTSRQIKLLSQPFFRWQCQPVNLWGWQIFANLNLVNFWEEKYLFFLIRNSTSCGWKLWELGRWKNCFSLHISMFGLRPVFHSGFTQQSSPVETSFRAVLNVTQSSHLIQMNFKFILNSCFIWQT